MKLYDNLEHDAKDVYLTQILNTLVFIFIYVNLSLIQISQEYALNITL